VRRVQLLHGSRHLRYSSYFRYWQCFRYEVDHGSV
jgi:hypothetical protein